MTIHQSPTAPELETLSGVETVLVTGGAGFIGSHLVDALVKNHEVRVLDDLSTGIRENVHPDAEFIKGDIQDQDTVERAMEDVDVVFHQAAMVSVEDSIQRPLDSHAANATGTLHILEAARKVDSRVVAASSAAIYGHPKKTPMPESELKTPTSPYGIQKLALDHYLQQYNELYGLPTVALRYFNVYGPRQQGGDYSGVISIFKTQAETGDLITVDGDGGQTRDFIHVDDVVQANLRAATADVAGEAFNIGTGTSISIRELAETVNELTGGNSDIKHRDPRSGDIRHSEAEISKARSKLRFQPQVTVNDGLRDMLE